MGFSLQRGRVMSISPAQRMPYLSRKARIASLHFGPPSSPAQPSVEEAFVLYALQIRDDGGMPTDDVGDVEELEAHLGRDVVRD